MTSKEYQQKLRDPRWQQKRLRIFERDSWRCTVNGCTHAGLQLHVHHKKYMPGDPWDIPDRYLITICEYHHRQAHRKSLINRVRYIKSKK